MAFLDLKPNFVRTPFRIALVIAVLIFGVVLFLVGTIPPQSQTAKRMKLTMECILAFAHQHNRLPSSLAELSAMAGKCPALEDAWGTTLVYKADDTGFVTLTSLGADARPGGGGEDRDMVATFNVRDSEGRWQNKFTGWKNDPL